MVAIQEGIGALWMQSQASSFARGLASSSRRRVPLTPYRGYEVFNKHLVILLVRASHHMFGAVLADYLGEVLFKLQIAIGLDDMHLAKTAGEDFQHRLAILSGQTREMATADCLEWVSMAVKPNSSPKSAVPIWLRYSCPFALLVSQASYSSVSFSTKSFRTA